MDLDTQSAIKRLADEHGSDELLVLLGAPDAEAVGIAAETVVIGDPSYAGPLAEAQLGLAVYHVLEDDVRAAVPEDVYDEQVGIMLDVIAVEEVAQAVAEMREKASA